MTGFFNTLSHGSYKCFKNNLTVTLLSMLYGFKWAGSEEQIQNKHLLALESRLCRQNLPQEEGSLAFPSPGQANFHKHGEPFTYLARFLKRLPPNGRIPSNSIFSAKNYLQNSHYKNWSLQPLLLSSPSFFVLSAYRAQGTCLLAFFHSNGCKFR